MKYEVKRNKVGDIVSISSFKVHTMANIVPLDENLDSLKASIKSTGLIHPVTLYKGDIIDGRRRTMACLELGIIPEVEDIGLEKDLTDSEIHNIVLGESTRRSLSKSQKAIIAAKETLVGRHKLTDYKNATDYAKVIWDISHGTLRDAKWLVKNYKSLAEDIFEYGFVTYDSKRWSGVQGLVALLKKQKTEDKESNPESKEIALAFEEGKLCVKKLSLTLSKEEVLYVIDSLIKDYRNEA